MNLATLSLVLMLSCPDFRHTVPTDWSGTLYIGGTVHVMPAPGIRMAALLWTDEGKFVDARMCGEGETISFQVAAGKYFYTIKFADGAKWIRTSDMITVGKVYQSPCGVCHD